MNQELDGFEATMFYDYKGGKAEIVDDVVNISKDDDYVKQYFGMWQIIAGYIQDLNAKKVLEFGTREGYSTQLFSKLLKLTGGEIITIDKDVPKDADKLWSLGNVKCVKTNIEELKWDSPVDILYIDDWHDPSHLYAELWTFAKYARVVMIHDVCLEHNNEKSLLKPIQNFCIANWIIWTVYPLNECGLAVLEMEKSMNHFKKKEIQ